MNLENYKKVIVTDLGEFKLSLITNDFIYYVNHDESDENGCVIMMNKKGKVVSDNYFAYGAYEDDMEKILNNTLEYEYVSEEDLSSAKEYFERYSE